MLLHDVTRCFRRVFKNPIKIVFFEHLVARCKKQKEKNIPPKKGEKGPNCFTPLLGGGP